MNTEEIQSLKSNTLKWAAQNDHSTAEKMAYLQGIDQALSLFVGDPCKQHVMKQLRQIVYTVTPATYRLVEQAANFTDAQLHEYRSATLAEMKARNFPQDLWERVHALEQEMAQRGILQYATYNED